MSAPRLMDGVIPRQRARLPRQRKNVHLELRMTVYTKLIGLATKDELGREEPMVAVVERLIEQAALPQT